MPVAFLSYARTDLSFARALHDALSRSGEETAWDQDHTTVRLSAPWWEEIKAAIRTSRKFIIVISPDSLGSDVCADERAYAKEMHIPVIPVLWRPAAPGQEVPEDLGRLNWIRFDDAAFDTRLAELIGALNTDLDISTEHAWLLGQTADWNSSGSNRGGLLHGQNLKRAKAFLRKAPGGGPLSPTHEQREYVAASRRRRQLWRSVLAAVVAIGAVAGTFAAVQFSSVSRQSIADTIANEADQVAPTDPSLAAQFDVAANAAYSTPDSETRLLATSTEPLSSTLTGPGRSANSVAFSRNGKVLAAGASDGKVWLWNLADPAHPARLAALPTGPHDEVDAVAFSPDGTALATGNDDGMTQLWSLDVDAAIRRICATTGHDLTAAVWGQDLPHLSYAPPCAHPGHYGLLTP